MSTYKSRLIESILTEFFGETVASVGICLYKRGRSTLSQLSAYLKPLPPKAIRDCLYILMQHNLCTFAKNTGAGDQVLPSSMVKSQGLIVIVYQLDDFAVLWMQRYPRAISFTETRFGKNHGKVVQCLIECGKANPSTISTRTGLVVNEIKEIVKSLVDLRFLRAVEPEDSLTPSDVQFAKEDLKVHQTDTVTLMAASSRSTKRVLVDEAASLPNKRLKTLDCVIEENVYYAINLPRYTVEFRHQIVRHYTKEKLNESAAKLVDCIFDVGSRKYSHPRDDAITPGISLHKLVDAIPKSVNFVIHGSSGNAENNSVRTKYINQYLEVLCSPQMGIVSKVHLDDGRDGFASDYRKIGNILAQTLIEAYIQETMGGLSTRIYRIIREKKILDDKTLSKLALSTQKEVRERLFRLLKVGAVEMQEVPRSADRAPARTTFLWKVSTSQHLIRVMLYRAYKIMSNLRDRRAHEMTQRKALLTKLERSDVSADLSLLSTDEQRELNQYKLCTERLMFAEIQLDQEIMILRDI